MKRILIILQILFVMSGLRAQGMGISFSFGGSAYQMDDLKYYQEYMLSTFPVEGKIVNSFPPYSSFSFNFFKKFLPMLKLGAGYGFSAAGGRVTYSDYSGNITSDVVANSHRLGAFASYAILGGDRMELSLMGRIDANFSRVETSTTIYVLGFSDGGSYKYNSFSPNASAGIEFLYNFSNFSLGMEAGYLVDFPGKLKNADTDSDFTIPPDRSRILTTDWTGWRAGLKCIIWLK